MATTDEVDARYFQVIDQLNRLKEHVPDLIQLEDFPKYLVCGVENVGKTTLLEAIAGVPLGYRAEGTATRCPVEYTLIKHLGRPTDPLIGFTLGENNNAHPRPLSELTQAIREHMLSLGNSFSNQVLRVRVVDPDLKRNMIFLDTPGFKPNAEEYRSQIEEVVKSLACQKQYSLIIVYKHNASVANNLAPGYCSGVLNSVRPGWDQERSTIFVYNQLNSTIASEFRTLEILQSELNEIGSIHRNQRVFNVALRIAGSPYEQALSGPQPMDRALEVEALGTIERSEMEWLENLPRTEPYVGLVIPAEFSNTFGVRNLVGHVHRMWKRFVDDNARTLNNELLRVLSREHKDIAGLAEDLASKKAGLDTVRENIDKYKSMFLDHFRDIVEGEINCKELIDPAEIKPTRFVDLCNPDIFARHIDRSLGDHLSLVEWNTWDAFGKVATQQRMPRPAAPPPQEPTATKRIPLLILEGPSDFPSVVLSPPGSSTIFVRFEDLRPNISTSSCTYTLWWKFEGGRWTPESKIFTTRMCTKEIDLTKTLWVFVEINDTNMRSKVTRFDPTRNLAVYDVDQDQAVSQQANLEEQRSTEIRMRRQEIPVAAARPAEPVLSGDLAHWQRMFGNINWAYRSRKAHGTAAVERLINSFALVLFNTKSNESDLEPLTRIYNQQGDGDAAAVLQHCLKSMIREASGGTKQVSQTISKIVLEYPPVVFNYLAGTKLHQSMEAYLESVERLILDEISEIVEKEAKNILEDWQDKVFSSLGKGWRINFLDPIVMAMYMSNFSSSVPPREVLERARQRQLTQVNNNNIDEEFNRNLLAKQNMLKEFAEKCGDNNVEKFDPIDLAFPCVLSPLRYHQEQMHQLAIINELQDQAKEIFWHILNVALPVLRAHVHDRFIQITLGKENLRQRLDQALKKKVQVDESSDVPPMDFVERIVNTKAFRDGISRLESEIDKKKRAVVEIVAARNSLESFLSSI